MFEFIHHVDSKISWTFVRSYSPIKKHPLIKATGILQSRGENISKWADRLWYIFAFFEDLRVDVDYDTKIFVPFTTVWIKKI